MLEIALFKVNISCANQPNITGSNSVLVPFQFVCKSQKDLEMTGRHSKLPPPQPGCLFCKTDVKETEINISNIVYDNHVSP